MTTVALLMAAGTAVTSAYAGDATVVLELVAVKFKAGVNAADHDQAGKAVAAMIAKQAGFISRETVSGPNGEWFAIVHWATTKDAENAAAIFMKSPEGQASMAQADPNSVLFKHYVAAK